MTEDFNGVYRMEALPSINNFPYTGGTDGMQNTTSTKTTATTTVHFSSQKCARPERVAPQTPTTPEVEAEEGEIVDDHHFCTSDRKSTSEDIVRQDSMHPISFHPLGNKSLPQSNQDSSCDVNSFSPVSPHNSVGHAQVNKHLENSITVCQNTSVIHSDDDGSRPLSSDGPDFWKMARAFGISVRQLFENLKEVRDAGLVPHSEVDRTIDHILSTIPLSRLTGSLDDHLIAFSELLASLKVQVDEAFKPDQPSDKMLSTMQKLETAAVELTGCVLVTVPQVSKPSASALIPLATELTATVHTHFDENPGDVISVQSEQIEPEELESRSPSLVSQNAESDEAEECDMEIENLASESELDRIAEITGEAATSSDSVCAIKPAEASQSEAKSESSERLDVYVSKMILCHGTLVSKSQIALLQEVVPLVTATVIDPTEQWKPTTTDDVYPQFGNRIQFRSVRLEDGVPTPLVMSQLLLGKLNIDAALCPESLISKCVNPKCPFQHESQVKVSEDDILCDLLSYSVSGLTPTDLKRKVSEICSKKSAQTLEAKISAIQAYVRESGVSSYTSRRVSAPSSERNTSELASVLDDNQDVSSDNLFFLEILNRWRSKTLSDDDIQFPRGTNGNSDVEKSFLNSITVLKTSNDPDAAIGEIIKGVEAHPTSPDIWLLYLELLISQDESDDEIREEFERALLWTNYRSFSIFWRYNTWENAVEKKLMLCDRALLSFFDQNGRIIDSGRDNKEMSAFVLDIIFQKCSMLLNHFGSASALNWLTAVLSSPAESLFKTLQGDHNCETTQTVDHECLQRSISESFASKVLCRLNFAHAFLLSFHLSSFSNLPFDVFYPHPFHFILRRNCHILIDWSRSIAEHDGAFISECFKAVVGLLLPHPECLDNGDRLAFVVIFLNYLNFLRHRCHVPAEMLQTTITEILTVSSMHPELYLFSSEMEIESGNYDAAEALLRKSVGLMPSNTVLWNRLLLISFRRRSLEGVSKVITDANLAISSTLDGLDANLLFEEVFSSRTPGSNALVKLRGDLFFRQNYLISRILKQNLSNFFALPSLNALSLTLDAVTDISDKEVEIESLIKYARLRCELLSHNRNSTAPVRDQAQEEEREALRRAKKELSYHVPNPYSKELLFELVTIHDKSALTTLKAAVFSG